MHIIVSFFSFKHNSWKFFYRLEVQADVSSNKRFSLSSHSETASATVSLSERSANMSLADDASTKALAGSILGYRLGNFIVP